MTVLRGIITLNKTIVGSESLSQKRDVSYSKCCIRGAINTS